MLIQSKNKNEKIILGLLSYTLEEGQHQTDLLQSILETYRQSDSKEIYLYREQDQDNFIGLVGVETFQSPGNESEHPESVVIDRIALLPSFRNESVGYQIFCELITQGIAKTEIGFGNVYRLGFGYGIGIDAA